MKRLLVTASLIASSMFGADNGANSINPNAVMIPYVWAICESEQAPEFLCRSFQPGKETYLLYLQASNDRTVAFSYKISGIRADGQKLVVTGVVLKRDKITQVVIDFGAPVRDSEVGVVELGVS